MRRFVVWIGGAVGGLAAYRFLRRHAEPAPVPEVTVAEPDERARQLRAKLAETRVAGESATEEPAADAPPPEAPAEPVPAEAATEPAAEEAPAEPPEPAPLESLDERRRRVHEEGRATLDEMQSE